MTVYEVPVHAKHVYLSPFSSPDTLPAWWYAILGTNTVIIQRKLTLQRYLERNNWHNVTIHPGSEVNSVGRCQEFLITSSD